MAKKLKFYSVEENAFILNYAASAEPVREELLQKFCVDNDRPVSSVMCKIYYLRRELKKNKNSPLTASIIRDNSIAKMSKGEFKIPVNNWNISNENGQMYLNIKF